MGFFDKIRGELIDIVQWTDDSRDTMVYRFERYENEIKMGAQLVVRESQVAVFINQGQLADVFQPGHYTLETQNMPILSTLKGWKHGFHSPFKAEVYFINTRTFNNLKWGTKNPITLRDPEFGPIRIRAFGSYAIKVTHAERFIKEIVGTDGHFTTDEITDQLRNLIISRFSDIVGEAKIPVLDMASNYDEFGDFVRGKLFEDFKHYGIDIQSMLVENISLPEAVEQALDKRTSMGVLGNLNNYTQFQTANAIEAAANNPSGMASGGMEMGMGFAMANQMGQSLGQQHNQQTQQPARPPTPPPLPTQTMYHVASNGQTLGPMPVSDIKNMVSQGTFNPDTLVWCEGMANWTKAGEITEIKSLFAAVPPPLPPQ
ncbi:SPFH domain-containing protein [Marinicellulosiphila megalodicopiae]|uniref:SPFH domain-containing protein n=1 Tax=Marinicellulosiphila megalodicopiae TaxID=2724896 RepID=UPI003BAF5DC0